MVFAADVAWWIAVAAVGIYMIRGICKWLRSKV